jgi:hypothetical protein
MTKKPTSKGKRAARRITAASPDSPSEPAALARAPQGITHADGGEEQFKAWVAAHFIGRREVLYRQTKNPIHVWKAYITARQLAVGFPDWVLSYFDRSAEALTTRPFGSAKAIADALGLGKAGGPSVTRKAATDERNLAIVERIVALKERPTREELQTLARTHGLKCHLVDPGDRSLLEILTQVAEEFRLDVKTVQSIYYAILRGPHDPSTRL